MRGLFLEENVHAPCTFLLYLCTQKKKKLIKMEMQQRQTERQKIARRMASEYLAFLIDKEKLISINQSNFNK